jgi:stress response protein SCP2
MTKKFSDKLKFFQQDQNQNQHPQSQPQKPPPKKLNAQKINFFEEKIQENIILTEAEKLEQKQRNEARERNQQRRLDRVKVLKANEETKQVSLLTINSVDGPQVIENPLEIINMNGILFENNNSVPEKIRVGCGWITETDLDLSIVGFNSDLEKVDYADYTKKKGFGETIIHNGDNTRGSETDLEDAETIDVNLKNLPKEVKTLVIILISYRGLQFHQISKSWMSLTEPASKKVILFHDIKTSEECTSLLFAALHRNDLEDWNYVPINKFFNSTRPNEAYNFTINFLKADNLLNNLLEKSKNLTI